MAISSVKKRIINVLAIAATCLACGCTDDFDFGGVGCPEGEESTVTLQVDVTDMTVLSRAADTDVNTLWVGIYNAASGLCTYNHLYGSGQTSPAEASNQFATLRDIECKSGRSYIVAVANPVGSSGMDLTGNKSKQPLEELLAQADTWAKYLAIASDASMADETHISVGEPTGAMLMEGAYSAAHKAGEAAVEVEAVDIRPGANVLTGAIHLRRLLTQNTLNISVADNIISMEVREIEIVNVPICSWLHGRTGSATPAEVTDYANAGDAFNPDGPATGNACYHTSLKFNPPDAVKLENGVYKFSFWQYENKRTGLESCVAYADREREYKNAADGKNSGIYSSLSASAAGDLNNNATYVKISANVEYNDPKNLVNPDGVAGLPSSGSTRTATVTYVVHLGYVGNDPKDFNCYRNSKYTYNITARSVSDVLLEAFREGEHAPGAEGIVTDVTDEFIELDAHAGVFNIYLTAEDIRTFSFTMRTYEYGEPHVVRMNIDGSIPTGIPEYGSNDFKYYNWIEFVPTGNTDESRNADVLAPYPRISDMRPGRSGVYYPHELRGSGLPGQWFTVYVNEYTYEKRYGETGYGDESGTAWKGYVKQPARQAWFNVEQQVSDDGESVYFGSKYAFRQQSIQTYYDTDVATCTTALGLEHDNESFGMNVRWTLGFGNYDSNNGRLNAINALQSSAWSTAVNRSALQKVNAINNTTQATLAGLATGQPTIYHVPANVSISANGGYNYNKAADDNDPQTSSSTAQYLQALYACMNRNRDENGNGTIDLEEIKWYLPSSGNYLRMILGRATLPTPLMDYSQPTLPAGCGGGQNTLYHYISSDAKIIWVDEGASSSNFSNSTHANINNNWNRAPWQLRCIRSLGTNLTSSVEQVSAAYDDSDWDSMTRGGMVKVTHYYGTALREPTTGALPFHKTDAQENKIALYGFEIAPAGNSFTGSHTSEAEAHFIFENEDPPRIVKFSNFGSEGDSGYQMASDSIAAGTPCSNLNASCSRKGWRVPNQKEVIIMMRMGVFRGTYIPYEVEAKQSGSWWNPSYTYTISAQPATGLDGAVLSCTQEHWANFGTPGSSTLPMSWNYRIVSVVPGSNIANAPSNSGIQAVRCVRDLTQAEAAMTYSQLVAGN